MAIGLTMEELSVVNGRSIGEVIKVSTFPDFMVFILGEMEAYP